MDEDSSAEWKTCRVCCFGKHNVLRLDLKQSTCQERFGFSKRKEAVIPHREAEAREGTGTNSRESGMRNVKAESIGGRVESTSNKNTATILHTP